MRFGIEEEFFVVDPDSRAVVPSAAAVIDRATSALGDRVGGEITKLHVETRTEPCLTLEDLYSQLVSTRQALCEAARAEGVRIAASGTPVLGRFIPPPITEGPRQDRGMATFRGLHDELAICATHVHVEIPQRERALMVSNHLRPFLPTLLAMMANSPFWAERDTGYASWRTMTWPRWPVAGPPPYFESAEHYDRLVTTLLDAGALVDSGTIFWDVRPSSRLPTLEVRVADTATTAEEAALLGALVRALVATVLPLVDAGDPGPVPQPELLRLAYWRAARDGLSGDGLDVHTGRLVPASELVRRLVDLVRPELDDQATVWLKRLLEGGDGATRQRRAGPALPDIVDRLIQQVSTFA